MMVKNAAFIADPLPVPAAPAGAAVSGATPGAGGFQQLLQGKQQSQGKQAPGGEAKQASAADRPAPAKPTPASSRPEKAEGRPEQPERAGGSARQGLPAEASQTPAAQKAAVATGKLPAQAKKEGAKEQDPAVKARGDQEAPQAEAGAAWRASSGNLSGSETVAQEVKQTAQAPESASADQAGTAATGSVPATDARPEQNPGLVVAMAAVEAGMAVRSEGGNAEAGATAAARLAAVQQRQGQPAPAETVAETEEVQPQYQQAANRQNPAADVAAGAKLGQEAELGKITREVRGGEVLPSTGATEGAQVENTAVPAAQGAVKQVTTQQVTTTAGTTTAGTTPQVTTAPGTTTEKGEISIDLPDAAKDAVTADQAVAAAHLSAKETGEGRFVAMPVRNLSANAGESTAASQPDPSRPASPQQETQRPQSAQLRDETQPQQGAQQQEAPVRVTAAQGGADSSSERLQGAQAEQATFQVKGDLPGEKAAAQKEQQPEPIRVAADETGQVAEKAPAQQERQAEPVRVLRDEAGQAAEQAISQQEQAEPVQPLPDPAVQVAEKTPQRRELRQGEPAGVKQVLEAEQARQGNLVKPSGEEVSGGRSASMATAKAASEQSAVGEMSGAHGEQGASRQKGEEGQNTPMPGAGMTVQGGAAEAAQGETKHAGGRSPLHENILSQVREGVVTHDGKGNGQMSIRLNPGELGELKIRLSMENNRLNVQVQADNPVVKELLLSNLDSLREALSGKNLTMEGFNVSTGGGGFNGPLNEERGNQRQQQAPRFARGAGYDGQEAPRVNYLTAEVNNLLDVRF